MGQIKIVFFDIDGTLVSFETHRVPVSTLEAVHEMRQKGVKVYIATGRPLQFIDNLGVLEYDGMITVTGAHCFTREGRVISHSPVPKESVKRVVEYLEREDDAYPVIFVSTDNLFVTKINKNVNEVLSLLNLNTPPVGLASSAEREDVLQMISFFKADREEALMKELMPDCTSMRWHPLFTDVIASNVDKAVGIDKVLAYEGLNIEQAMAFGDGGNDVSMLAHVKYGVAMGNACEELKVVASYVTDTVDDDGVVKALKLFGLID